ncbi:MAG: hypothetical protein ACXW2U_02470 [Telluria sp.]
MQRQTLKDSRHRIIGFIDTASDGRQTARDQRFHVVGYYEPQTNLTKDGRFRVVGYGNLLPSLISCD